MSGAWIGTDTASTNTNYENETMSITNQVKLRIAGLSVGIGLLSAAVMLALPGHTTTESYIVQGADLATARAAVAAVGGEITHELGIIHAVGARLSAEQSEALRAATSVRRLYENRGVETAKKKASRGATTLDVTTTDTGNLTGSFNGYTEYPAQVGAAFLHDQGLLGDGITLAVLDSGLNADNKITRDSDGRRRLEAHYDATTDRLLSTRNNLSDKNGHGNHVTSIVADPSTDPATGRHNGIAPCLSRVREGLR